MNIKVSKIQEARTFDGSKTYTEIDITNQVVMPIIDVERLDATLDTSSLTLINSDENAIEPFTRVIIRITNADNTTDNIYRLVERDDVTIYKYGTNPEYTHELQLVEITKWLERFEVDNTTITNFLAFLYTDEDTLNALGIKQEYTQTERKVNVEGDPGTVWDTNVEPITPDITIYNTYTQNARLKTAMRYQCSVKHNYWHTIIPPLIVYPTMDWVNASLYEYTITAPDNTTTNLTNTQFFDLTQVGRYTIKQVYRAYLYGGDDLNIYSGENIYYITLTWVINVIEASDIEKLPTKYTLSQVVDAILNKVGNEATVIREGIDEPMFSLDASVRAKFDTIIAPEFTFTQDTLFGVLSKIGEVAHAIPRLLTNPVPEAGTIDDYSDWNIITFDFLGGDEEAPVGEVALKGSYYDGNDYTTNYVSNVQNSFQTNDAEYITLTEPYEGGWVSPRTENGSYEISNDNAVIKTSRPIQRIVSLECLWFDSENESIVLDLSQYVREITDYNLMTDYTNNNAISSKQNHLYYTRGSNIIGGLTYQKPAFIGQAQAFTNRAIENIINIVYGSDVGDITIKNLKFRIKYVPFYDLKVKQYKPYVSDHSGNNELFYNQVNTQTVDIDSLGEAMKGALLRVANEEPNVTEYFTNHNECIKAGQLLNDNYYAYQVNKEINEKRIKATVQFSKDFNKWNAYVAIKKNYREWEISERESIETNPVYSNFCIITDKPEFYVLLGIYETEEPMTDSQLNALIPTPIESSPAWQSADQFMAINKVGNTYTKCKTYNDHYTRKWERQEIYLKDGILDIGEKYLSPDATNAYYEGLKAEKGVLNDKFFNELVARMANINAPAGKFNISSNVNATITKYIQEKYGRDPKAGDYVINIIPGVINPYWKYTYTDQWTAQEITRAEYEELEPYIMNKISWVVGNCYSNEWQGGTDYKQVKKSFILPCACFSLGNSVVFDFGAKDNYAIGTYSDDETSQYALERYIEYGDKFGKVENLELQYGHTDAIDKAFETNTKATANAKKLYTIDTAEVNTKNVLIDYQTDADFEINADKIYKVWWSFAGYPSTTTPIPIHLYMALKDQNTLIACGYSGTDKIINETVTKLESSTQFQFSFTIVGLTTTIYVTPNSNGAWVDTSTPGTQGSQYNYEGVIIEDNETYYAGTSSITTASATYTITLADQTHKNLTLNDGTYKYYSYKTTGGMFRVNKDSRQSLQFTNQLHFITDNKDIWIGSALAKTMPFVGMLENGIYKLVGFTQRPSKFEIVPNPDDYEEITGADTKWSSTKTYTMKLYGKLAQNNYKGVGLLDNKNRLVLYYNKEVGAGEYTPTLYVRLRRKL